MSPASEDKLLLKALLRKIARAAEDPAAFFEFVMREETSRARLRTLPHQHAIFSFAQEHPRCVIRCPVGSSKTYTMTALGLYHLGRDPTARGAIISSLEGQAAKPVGMVRDYIEQSVELRAAFPRLRPSQRAGDLWTQTKLIVDRPAGIRDPSLVAAGIDSASLPGSRLSWVLIDDILDEANTSTPLMREKVRRWFLTTVLSRRDIVGSRVVVTNTPWHPEDLTYYLEQKAGWPTLTMSIEGDVLVSNADAWLKSQSWLRPSRKTEGEWRLVSHDQPQYLDPLYGDEEVPAEDEDDLVPLWPEKFPREATAKLREDFTPYEFDQLFRCRCSNDRQRVRVEWIDGCKRVARERRVHGVIQEFRQGWPTYTGVDLAIGQTGKHHQTAFFTFAVTPDFKRQILDVEAGHFTGRAIVDKLISIQRRYESIIRVENNAAQDFLLQWARDVDASLLIRPHTTGRNKADPTHGVESIFIELEKELWLIPNAADGRCPKPVQEWVDAIYSYSPGAHTPDLLMATWFAREQARHAGTLRARPTAAQAITSLMAR